MHTCVRCMIPVYSIHTCIPVVVITSNDAYIQYTLDIIHIYIYIYTYIYHNNNNNNNSNNNSNNDSSIGMIWIMHISYSSQSNNRTQYVTTYSNHTHIQ